MGVYLIKRGFGMEVATELTQQPDANLNAAKQSPVESGNYNVRIPRKLLEGITNLSTNTIVRHEQEGDLTPIRVKHGAVEVVTYSVEDVQQLLRKRGSPLTPKTGKPEVIAIWSQKGGVGKSAFTQHVSSILSLVGKTLVIDLDSQADATSLFNLNVKYSDVLAADDELEPTVAELMDWELEEGYERPYRQLSLEQVVKKISPTLHVVPGDLDLGEINYSLNRLPLKEKFGPNGEPRPSVLYMLKDVIETYAKDYDFVVFDCPPNIEALNVNALFAANRILMVLELEAKCLRTLKRNEDFLEKLRSIHPGFNWDKILIVPNKFSRSNIKIKALAKLQDLYGERGDIQLSETVFPTGTIIDRCSEAREPMFSVATRYGKDWKASIPAAKEFTDLFWVVCHEILGVDLNHLIFAAPSEPEV